MSLVQVLDSSSNLPTQLKATSNVLQVGTTPSSGTTVANCAGYTGYAQTRQTVEITCPATASGAYLAGDRLGPATSTTLAEITNMALANGRGGEIRQIQVIINKKSLTPRLRIHFYNASNPTELVADTAPYKSLYADNALKVGYLDLVACTTAADTSGSDNSRTQEVYAGTFPMPFLCGASSTSLWIAVETLDAITTLDNGTKITVIVKAIQN